MANKTEKTINEIRYRFAGSVNANKELELGMDIDPGVEFTVVKQEDHDLQNGTFDRVFVLKALILKKYE